MVGIVRDLLKIVHFNAARAYMDLRSHTLPLIFSINVATLVRRVPILLNEH